MLGTFHKFSFNSLNHAREVFTLEEVELRVKSFVQDHSQEYNPDVSIPQTISSTQREDSHTTSRECPFLVPLVIPLTLFAETEVENTLF